MNRKTTDPTAFLGPSLPDDIESCHAQIRILKAEVARLRNLVEYGCVNAARTINFGPYRGPFWAAVKEIFPVGKTTAHRLCEEFGLDPDKEVRPCEDDPEADE